MYNVPINTTVRLSSNTSAHRLNTEYTEKFFSNQIITITIIIIAKLGIWLFTHWSPRNDRFSLQMAFHIEFGKIIAQLLPTMRRIVKNAYD